MTFRNNGHIISLVKKEISVERYNILKKNAQEVRERLDFLVKWRN